MSRITSLLACIGLVVLCVPPARAVESADETQMVRTYLDAYIRHDMPVVRTYSPTDSGEQFGAFPFTGFPTLGKTTVDRNQALVEFSGDPRATGLPHHGGLLFYRDIRDHNIWKLRQVLFYTHIPAIFNLPTRSKTAIDQGYEPTVAALARRCLQAWQRGDTDTLLAHWHNWTRREGVPITGLSVSDFHVVFQPVGHHEQFARYTAHLTYKWGVLSYSMPLDSGVFLTKEGTEWRVRGNVMAFYF